VTPEPRSTDELVQAIASHLAHRHEMLWAMAMTTAMIGVPYGPALCEARPSKLRGILMTTEPPSELTAASLLDEIMGRPTR
jgi:hypothetical protein